MSIKSMVMYEEYKTNVQQAICAAELGDVEGCKQCCYKAAISMLKLAKEASGSIQEIRKKSAGNIVALADSITTINATLIAKLAKFLPSNSTSNNMGSNTSYVGSNAGNNLGNNAGSNVGSNAGNNVGSYTGSNVGSYTGSSMGNNASRGWGNIGEGKGNSTSEGMGESNQQREAAEERNTSSWLVCEVPNVRFSDIAGLEDVKESINVRMIYPVKYKEKYQLYKKKTGGGVLLYGPPGTGKTMIAKAVANEVGGRFYSIKSSDIVTKWVGDSERNIKLLFEEVNRDKDSLAVLFFDELDSLFGERGKDIHNDKRVNEFLTQIDGITGQNPNLLLLGSTNRPWDVEAAARRPGRFSELIYVGLPDENARRFIITRAIKSVPCDDTVNVDDIVSMTEGYSGADIEELCDRAKIPALLESIAESQGSQSQSEGDAQKIDRPLNANDFLIAKEKVPPTITADMLPQYKSFRGK